MSRTSRIYVDAALEEGASVDLDDKAARHVTRVLRLRSGDPLNVFDGRGSEHRGQILPGRGKGVRIQLGRAVRPVPESPLAIRLLQGISRGERMDLVVQKATELGVASIHPLLTSRSVVRLDEDRARRRTEHWRGVATAACEQSGRAVLPRITMPLALPEALAALPETTDRLLLDPGASVAMTAAPLTAPEVAVLIGPEGGLDESERKAAGDAGFLAVGIGPRILRTETAALAAVALLQSMNGDLSSRRR